MAHYDSPNFMCEQDLLTDEERLVQSSTRNFVTKEILPTLQSAHREERFPKELVAGMAQMGLLGPTSTSVGGPGMSNVCYGIMMQELERADSGIRSFCSVQGSLVIYPIEAFGSETQKEKYLPPLRQGEMIGCFGLTESDAGSNPGGMKTRATKCKGGYKLSGSKMWITNGCIADIAIVWARCEEDQKIRGFIVEKDSAGYKTQTMTGKFSLRVSVTSELVFDNCFVSDENVLPDAIGLKGPLSCLTQARYGIAWGVIGAAQTCYTTALDYAKNREIFDRPLAGFQLAQSKLVHMLQEITKAQLLVIQLGRLKDNDQLKNWQVSLAKMNNCQMALDIARQARDILGANGITDEYPVIRHMLNLETVNTYEGTEDIHRLIIGQQITGENAFK